MVPGMAPNANPPGLVPNAAGAPGVPTSVDGQNTSKDQNTSWAGGLKDKLTNPQSLASGIGGKLRNPAELGKGLSEGLGKGLGETLKNPTAVTSQAVRI